MSTTPEQQKDQPTPMTKARLADIRHLLEFARAQGYLEVAYALDDLASEVQRLEAECDALKKAVMSEWTEDEIESVVGRLEKTEPKLRRQCLVTLLYRIPKLEAERDAAVVEAAENADMATEFERLRDTMNDSFNHVEAERDAAAAEAAALREALQCLHDEQNGPPLLLPRHKSAWEQAMKDADAALSRPGPGAAFLTRLRAMEALLRRLEWAGDTSGTECVCCYATKANGHIPGCELAALLSAAPPAGGGGGT